MPRWSQSELDAYQLKRSQARNKGATSIVERSAFNGPLAAPQIQAPTPKRVLVRVTSIRNRLLDEDNLCEKFHVDCLRFAGLISGDDPTQTKIEVSQRKTNPHEEEMIVIEITPL